MVREIMTGMVLSSAPAGEFDKRLVILTKERGKIAAFAKGARRPQSALLACGQPFVFGEFSIYAGRNSFRIASVEVHNYFEGLRNDLEGACYGFYFCEVTDYLTKENMDGLELLKLLYQTMRILTKRTVPSFLVRVIFEIKALSMSGEAPQVFSCVKCGKTEDAMKFFVNQGGLLCRSCAGKPGSGTGGLVLSDAALYTLQYIVATPVEKLYTFTVSDEVLAELLRVSELYTSVYLDHKFRSREMLDIL